MLVSFDHLTSAGRLPAAQTSAASLAVSSCTLPFRRHGARPKSKTSSKTDTARHSSTAVGSRGGSKERGAGGIEQARFPCAPATQPYLEVKFQVYLTTRTGLQLINPFRAAVPFWGQTTQNSTGVSPKRDCGSKRVKVVAQNCTYIYNIYICIRRKKYIHLRGAVTTSVAMFAPLGHIVQIKPP